MTALLMQGNTASFFSAPLAWQSSIECADVVSSSFALPRFTFSGYFALRGEAKRRSYWKDIVFATLNILFQHNSTNWHALASSATHTVDRGVVPLLFRWKGFVPCRGSVNIQVIHDQTNVLDEASGYSSFAINWR
jgi:hypothetical protein